MEELMIKIEDVSKRYRLGQIGGGTLQGDIQSWWARKRGKEDPNTRIGAKVYGKNETFMALDGISFEVKKGERVGIIGHNGAGKSTLLKLLSRVTAPTTGEIGLNGRITSMLEVGTGFHGELTGRENVYMNGAILGMTKKEIDEKIDQIIEFSECAQFIDTPVKRYSSGMYVKLAFSVAAHLDSEIMIMDEVLAVGDMAFQKKCLDKMNDVSRENGRTILYVSHNMNTIRQLCDRVIVLDHGKMIYDGEVEEGIALYMSNYESDIKSFNDYSNLERMRHIPKDRLIDLQSCEIMNISDGIVTTDDPLVLKIRWKNNGDIKDMLLRVEYKGLDGTPIATAITAQRIECDKCEVVLENDISPLADGKYKALIVAYEETLGRLVDYDAVWPAFEVIKDINNSMWDARHWGKTQLKDLEVK